jgi:hypothetical protein
MTDTVETRCNPADNITNRMPSKPNQASRSPDFSYLLVASILFTSSSLITLSGPQLCHYRRTLCKVLAVCLFMPWSWVNSVYIICWEQHTASTHYTEYNVHRVKYTLSIAYSHYSIHRMLSVFPSYLRLWVDPSILLQLLVFPLRRLTATSQRSMRDQR